MHITRYQYLYGLCYIYPPPPRLLLDLPSCFQGKHVALTGYATDERKREGEINTCFWIHSDSLKNKLIPSSIVCQRTS